MFRVQEPSSPVCRAAQRQSPGAPGLTTRSHKAKTIDLIKVVRQMALGLLQAPGIVEGSRGVPCGCLLRLESGGLHVGWSTDLEPRLRDHAADTACRATKVSPLPRLTLWQSATSLSGHEQVHPNQRRIGRTR